MEPARAQRHEAAIWIQLVHMAPAETIMTWTHGKILQPMCCSSDSVLRKYRGGVFREPRAEQSVPRGEPAQ